jgi:hypothetical protein
MKSSPLIAVHAAPIHNSNRRAPVLARFGKSSRKRLSDVKGSTLCLVLWALLAFTPPSARAIPTWAQTFGADSGRPVNNDFAGDYPRSIVRMPDGGAVVGGYLFVPGSAVQNNVANHGIFGESAVVRYAADGSIIWKKVLGPFALNASFVTPMVADPAGNIYLASGRPFDAFSGGQGTPYVAKFSADGTLLWATNVKLPGKPDPNQGNATPYLNNLASSIVLTSDGNVAVGGNYYPGGGGGHSVPYLAELSTAGQVVGAQYFENLHVQYSAVQAMAAGPNGNLLFVTLSTVDGTNYGNTFVLVDKDGKTIVERAYTSGTFQEQPAAINGTSDGGFILVSPAGRTATATIVRKLNADLTRQWEKAIYIDNYLYYGTSAEQTADGGYLIGARGRTASTTTETPPFTRGTTEKALLTKLDANGVVQKIFAIASDGFGDTGSPAANASIRYPSVATTTTDGGYAVAGPDASDWWIAKTDLTGKVRNYKGFMKDVTAEFKEVDNAAGIVETTDFFTVVAATENAGSPQLVITDPSQATVTIQASPPRILSAHAAEAVVGQHFAYQIIGRFFDAGATITYSVSGLPEPFVLDPKTGVISGVPGAGSETTTPILITLNATDGTNSANAVTLALTIGDGVPAFTVNDSNKPAYPPASAPTLNLADTVLSFAAKQPGALAGRIMTVEATTTPDSEPTWRRIDEGTKGFMTYDFSSQSYVLNATSYPHLNGLYFRSHVAAPSYNAVSNVVGPFNLSATSKYLDAPLMFISQNGLVANLRFGVTENTIPSGVAVTMQTSKSPSAEASWQSAPIGNSGLMNQDTSPVPPGDPKQFYLGADEYPEGRGSYFRAVASAPGFVGGISTVSGPIEFIRDPAAAIGLTLSVAGGGTISGGNGQTIDYPVVVSARSFNVTAKAQSGRPIKKLSLIYDGDIVESFKDAAAEGNTVLYSTNVAGDHLIEATAIDDLGVIGTASPIHIRVAPLAPGKLYLALTQSGDWNDAANWTDPEGNHGVPGANDFAVLGSFSPSLSSDVTVNALSLNGGTISGPGKLTVTGFFTIASGKLANQITIAAGATCELLNDDDIGLSGTIINAGRLKIHGKGGITGIKPSGATTTLFGSTLGPIEKDGLFDGVIGFIQNIGHAIFGPPAGGRKGSGSARPPSANPPPAPEVPTVTLARLDNTGIVKAPVVSDDGASLISQDGGTLISQDGGTLVGNSGGTLVRRDGTPLIASGGGNVVAAGAGNLIASGGGNLIASGGGNLIASGGGNILSPNSANFVATGGDNLIASGGGNISIPNVFSGAVGNAHAATAPSGYQQSGGFTDLSGITIIGAVSVNGGVIGGTGSIIGSLTNSGGFVAPGSSAGLLAVTGSFSQGNTGTMILEAGGGAAGQFDQLQIGGSASLGGKLDVRTINGYTPLPGDPFNPVGYSSVNGSFASVSGNVALTQTSNGLRATLDPAKPNPKRGQPVNIATRLAVQTGDNVLFAGFFVTGPAGSTKKVLIRGLGPSLPVSGTMSDPLLELHNPDGSTVANDNWKDGDVNVIPMGFSPSNDKESVIVATLTVGSVGYSGYTVILKGAHGEQGVGLVEVYDLDTAGVAQLANIATRGNVQTGDNVLIGGFIVAGTEPAKILVRATGPSSGVGGALADPILEVHDSNGSVIRNDNWRETQEVEITATGLAPKDNREPAVLATLVPGAYTAVVRGVNNTTGVAVVEAYNLQ